MTEQWLGALGDRPWRAIKAEVAAGRYGHEAVSLLQVRLIQRGSSYVTLDMGAGPRPSYTRPGDLLLSLPHSPTRFDLPTPRSLIVVAITERWAAAVLQKADADGFEDLAPLTTVPFRNPLAAELCRRLEQPGQFSAASLDAALALLVATLLEQARNIGTRPPARRLTGGSLRRVLDHIDQHIDEPLPVDDLAAVAGLPRRPFGVEFKLATGMPIHQYVLRRRVNRAVALLTETSRPIADIAAELGFTHQAHMTRLVRRLTGSTPAQHRTRSNGDTGSPAG